MILPLRFLSELCWPEHALFQSHQWIDRMAFSQNSASDVEVSDETMKLGVGSRHKPQASDAGMQDKETEKPNHVNLKHDISA